MNKFRFHGGFDGVAPRCGGCGFPCSFTDDVEIVGPYTDCNGFVPDVLVGRLENGAYVYGYAEQFEALPK